MKSKLTEFSRNYNAALKSYLIPTAAGKDADAARTQGDRAIRLGLETHDLARIHEEALFQLVSQPTTGRRRKTLIRAGLDFFTDASAAIEESRHGKRTATAHLKSIIGALTQRTKELAASNAKLKGEITQRKEIEKSLRTSEKTSSQLLIKSRRMQDELRLLSRRLLSVQEEERKRISRELHDVVAQALTGINVRLAMLKTQSTANAEDFHKKIATTQRLVQKSVEIVHRFARDLRPTVLDDLGLIPALQSYLKLVRQQTGLVIEFTTFAEVEKMDDGAKTVLYRIVQESLANVTQHAKATRVNVIISNQRTHIEMSIHDNGKGFHPDKIAAAKSGVHLGLLGMRERVEMVGGTFCVESTPGKQTTVQVEMPHQPTRKKATPSKKSNNASLECP